MSSAAASPILASGLMFGFAHASTPVLVVCGVLVALSAVCWTLMLSKLWMLSCAKREDRAFRAAYNHSPHPLAIYQMRKHHARAPLYHIYHAAGRELAFHLLGTDEPDSTFASRLHSAGRIMPTQMGAVAKAMERAAVEARVRLESRLPAAAAILTAAPFLGVLGTAWGVMEVLVAASGAVEPVTLQSLAPGLCAALLPTVAGLLVVLPGLFAHRYLIARIRALQVRHEHFASEFASVLQRYFVDHRPTADELPSIGSLVTPNMPAFGKPAAAMPSSPSPPPRVAREMVAADT
ncbi:MAG: MotA/TolQ/ExbB proton channel family protein [Verrucomicrobiaceae bacterium]|nr:MotA/TolQ/ExbB proton channel family protein [Verrucomicrobiaceae bacterium]